MYCTLGMDIHWYLTLPIQYCSRESMWLLCQVLHMQPLVEGQPKDSKELLS